MDVRRIGRATSNLKLKKTRSRNLPGSCGRKVRTNRRCHRRQMGNAFETAIALAKWDYQENGSKSDEQLCLSLEQLKVLLRRAHISTPTYPPCKNETPREHSGGSAHLTRRRRNRRSRRKAERLYEDEDKDSDSDGNEAKMKKLKAELERRRKIKKSIC